MGLTQLEVAACIIQTDELVVAIAVDGKGEVCLWPALAADWAETGSQAVTATRTTNTTQCTPSTVLSMVVLPCAVTITPGDGLQQCTTLQLGSEVLHDAKQRHRHFR